MLNYTLQHSLADKLPDLLEALSTSYRALRSGRLWQLIKQEYLIRHGVRSLEVTYGSSGWHPHYHELLFLDAEILSAASIEDIGASLERQIAPLWVEKLHAIKRAASLEHGFVVSTKPGDIAAYLNKYGFAPRQKSGWTEAAEITKQQSKRASLQGRTPTQLLYDYTQGDQQAGYLWRDYARATKRRSQLQWTRGAKAALGIGEISDDEAVGLDDLNPEKILLARIPLNVWKEITRRNKAAFLLRAIEREDFSAVFGELDSIDPSWKDDDTLPG
jgi:hypothetical protein